MPEQRPDTARRFRDAALEQMLGTRVAHMRLSKCMEIVDVRNAVALVEATVTLLRKRLVASATTAAPFFVPELEQIFDAVVASISKLNDVENVCEEQSKGHVVPLTRSISPDAAFNKKHFCFFSPLELISDAIQNDAVVRHWCLTESQEWSTGCHYMVPPTVIKDFKDAARFRWSPLARPADPADKILRVRVALDNWNDDFVAVNPIGVRRKDRKYGAFTGRILNLPPHLRDRPEHFLLLAIYCVKQAKKHGSTCRMLTGIWITHSVKHGVIHSVTHSVTYVVTCCVTYLPPPHQPNYPPTLPPHDHRCPRRDWRPL